MAIPRKSLIDLSRTPFYHCYSRCVRRSFLCGDDRYSGKNYDHRRQWIVNRMKQLSSIFCINIVAYAVMSNHYHLILHVDMDKALALSNEEVFDRWLALHEKPAERDEERQKRKNKLEQTFDAGVLRERLFDISWFMRFLNEKIARRANVEDQCTGRFWEGRFKSQALLNKGALLTCMAYTDLNAVRAGMAETLEASEFTSVQERILQYWDEAQKHTNKVAAYNNRQKYQPGSGLLPFSDTVPASSPPGHYLPVTRAEYFELVDWTGRELRDGKKGCIPGHIRPVLQRLALDEEQWLPSVAEYRQRFYLMVGHFSQLCEIATELNRVRFNGKAGVLALYREGPA